MARSFSRSWEYDYSKPAIIGINVTFMLLSITGNLLVIFSVSRTPSLRSPSTTLLCGLAASDVIVGLIAQPLFIIRELIPNDTLFHVVFFFSCNGCGVSLLTMTLISLDRYAALHYHMRYAAIVTSKRVICTLATMWFVIYVAFGIYLWKREVYFSLLPVSSSAVSFYRHSLTLEFIKLFSDTIGRFRCTTKSSKAQILVVT